LEDFESIQEKKRVIHSKIYAYLPFIRKQERKKELSVDTFQCPQKG
jgi:hypothetical protein